MHSRDLMHRRTSAHSLCNMLRSTNMCASRWCGQDHLCAMQMTRDTGCQVFIELLGFFIALQTSFWSSPSYPSGAISWYGMGLYHRNLLTSGSINLGPSCFPVCWGFFCCLLFFFFNLFVIVCFFFVWMHVWNTCLGSIFLLGQQAEVLHLWYAAISLLSSWCRVFCWWVIYAVVLPECRPFGRDINSTFLNFAAGNSVPKTMSREWCSSLLVQAVLLTLCSAVPSCVCTCTDTHTLLQLYCSHANLNISVKILDNSHF